VIILDENHVVRRINLVASGMRELLIQPLIMTPIVGSKSGTRVDDMTQGPEFIGETVVIALFFFPGEPDSPQRIRFFAERDAKVVLAINGGAVRGATPVRNPNAGTRMHHRFKRGDKPAGGVLNLAAAVTPILVNIRLAIGVHPFRTSGEWYAAQPQKWPT
jgi:hypothetical protein